MAIKINDDNLEKIDKNLKLVQKGCSTRRVSAIQILADVIPKLDIFFKDYDQSSKDGLFVIINMFAGTFSENYKGVPRSTHFEMIYLHGQWRYIGAYRAFCGKHSIEYVLTPLMEKEKAEKPNNKNKNVVIFKNE